MRKRARTSPCDTLAGLTFVSARELLNTRRDEVGACLKLWEQAISGHLKIQLRSGRSSRGSKLRAESGVPAFDEAAPSKLLKQVRYRTNVSYNKVLMSNASLPSVKGGDQMNLLKVVFLWNDVFTLAIILGAVSNVNDLFIGIDLWRFRNIGF